MNLFKTIGFIIFISQINSNDDIIINFINSNYISKDLGTFFTLTETKKILPEECQKVVDDLKKLLERYVYLDILRNPPQTSDNTFSAKDLISELDSIICSIDKNLYDFHRQIKKIIDGAQDLHLSFEFNSKHNFQEMTQYYFISPVVFRISEGKIYAIPSRYLSYFDSDLKTKIEQNKEKDISLIGRLDPINYITIFHDGFRKLKSKQAQFVNNLYSLELISPNIYPFEESYLSDIIIHYSDDSIIQYSYKVLLPSDNNNKMLVNFINKNFNKFKVNFDLYEISKQFLIKNGLYQNLSEDKWNDFDGRKFSCKVDNEKKVNVFYQNTFMTEDNHIYNFLNQCFTLFDGNTYPIIVIESFNNGGSLLIANYLTEYINLNKPNTIYSSYRDNEEVKNYISVQHNGIFKNLDNCQTENIKNIFNNGKEIDYEVDSSGNKIKHKITKLFDGSICNRNVFYNFRKKAKNIRKPTEIIIYTDGFSYSATSNFIKETQLRGGAIIVGYNGNPNFKKFDASQSPSTVVNTINAENYNDIVGKDLEDLGFTLRYTVIESFAFKDDIKYPLEFEINEIDERVEIYNRFFDIYYDTFIDEANKIFDKYK